MKLTSTLTFIALLVAGHAASAASAGHPISIFERAEDKAMEEMVRKILALAGLHNNFPVVIHPNYPGCAYATVVQKRQFIGVDPGCVGPLRSEGSIKWDPVGTLAHEIAHHLYAAHLRENNKQDERDADEWAGWAMFKLGATLEEALAMPRRTPENGGDTHPGRAERIGLVTSGWNRARAERNGETIVKRVGENWWQTLMSQKLPWAAE